MSVTLSARLLLNAIFLPSFSAVRLNVVNYSLIFMIHDIGVTLVFAEVCVQRTKQCICIHFACFASSILLLLRFVPPASFHFIWRPCRLWRKHELRMQPANDCLKTMTQPQQIMLKYFLIHFHLSLLNKFHYNEKKSIIKFFY